MRIARGVGHLVIAVALLASLVTIHDDAGRVCLTILGAAYYLVTWLIFRVARSTVKS